MPRNLNCSIAFGVIMVLLSPVIMAETLETAWATALEHNHQIKAAQANTLASEQQLQSAQGQQLPELNVSTGYTQYNQSPAAIANINPDIIALEIIAVDLVVIAKDAEALGILEAVSVDQAAVAVAQGKLGGGAVEEGVITIAKIGKRPVAFAATAARTARITRFRFVVAVVKICIEARITPFRIGVEQARKRNTDFNESARCAHRTLLDDDGLPIAEAERNRSAVKRRAGGNARQTKCVVKDGQALSAIVIRSEV